MKPLVTLAKDVDRTLRGEYTSRDALMGAGAAGALAVGRLVWGSLLLGATYGVCMGVFPLLKAGRGGGLQMVATTLKVPLLFLLTLAVTFPSLYVFSALAGSRLGARGTLRLIVVAITVNLAVMAGFGPVTAFFASCTRSYPFIKLLNVLLFAIGGAIGLAFLWRTLAALLREGEKRPIEAATGGPSAGDPARRIFRVWIVLYGIVGMQMGWVLRPFIGAPHRRFEWFRERESHFFADVLETLGALFG